MPSKIKPIPVRLGDERKARVEIHAKETGKSVHAAMLDLIDRGLDAPEARAPLYAPLASDDQAAAVARNKTRAAKTKPAPSPELEHAGALVPLAGTFVRGPMQKAKPQGKSKWRL